MQLYYYIAWLQSIIALLGSLYFSEIDRYAPCTLCWYQRYVMYPLVVIIALGIVAKSPKLPMIVIPLSAIGLIIAGYHNLLYWNIIPTPEQVCATGVSCTTRYVEWFGFITIPLLSAAAFAIILGSMLAAQRTLYKTHHA